MAYKFGDVVVLNKKSPDGSLRRVNAIVIASAVQSADAKLLTGLRDHRGALLPAGEYLDLAFPREYPEGHLIKTRDMESLFQPAYHVAPWKEGAHVGWESAPTVEHIAALRRENSDLKTKLSKK
jgi:hypothetical protein